MKLIGLALAALFISTSAQAVMQPEGTFVPTQCGAAAGPLNLAQVCIGDVVGQPGQTISFNFHDGSKKLFAVSGTSNFMVALTSGNLKSMMYLVAQNGEKSAMKVIRAKDGSLRSAVGMMNEVEYVVPEFETAFSVQSAFGGF